MADIKNLDVDGQMGKGPVKIYQAGEFNLVTKRNKFVLGKHDGILEKGHLYLRKDLLLIKVQN